MNYFRVHLAYIERFLKSRRVAAIEEMQICPRR